MSALNTLPADRPSSVHQRARRKGQTMTGTSAHVRRALRTALPVALIGALVSAGVAAHAGTSAAGHAGASAAGPVRDAVGSAGAAAATKITVTVHTGSSGTVGAG